MSLINDALKRAKETQPQGVAAAGPSLQPVLTAQRARPDFLLPMLALVILLLAALLFWAWSHGVEVVKVRANSFPVAVTPSPVAEPSPVAPANPVVAAAAVEPMTNAVVAAPVVEPVKPVTYKLQSIFYFAKNPSAVINGKTVYAGSRVGEAHVVAIGKESATIMLATGETQLLELP
jgi:hypothetical protein